MKTSSRRLGPWLAGALLAAAAAGQGTPADGWREAAPGYAWRFPRDHAAHPAYRSEWWYLTGNLASRETPPRHLGYQFTLFRVGLSPERPPHGGDWGARALVMGHAALTDAAAGRHRFGELLLRATPLQGGFAELTGVPGEGLPSPLLAWSLAPAGTTGRWELRWNGSAFDLEARDDGQGFALELTTTPTKPLVMQGPGGLSRKSGGRGEASLYYSFPRLATRGRVLLDGAWVPVQGTSWFDKELGSGALPPDQVGWDWFSLQLADGRDLMLYVLRRADGTPSHAQGTLVDAAGAPTYLGPEAWRLTATGRWSSPENQAVYPSGWRLVLPQHGIDLVVTPRLAAAENRSRLVAQLAYWEGPVALATPDGGAAGEGYVELTGYGAARRPTR